MKCKYGQNGICEKLFHPNCPDSPECYEYDLYTNADRIRAMRIEELAILLANESFRIVRAALDAYGVKAEDKGMEKLYDIGLSRKVVWLLSPAEDEDSEDEE